MLTLLVRLDYEQRVEDFARRNRVAPDALAFLESREPDRKVKFVEQMHAWEEKMRVEWEKRLTELKKQRYMVQKRVMESERERARKMKEEQEKREKEEARAPITRGALGDRMQRSGLGDGGMPPPQSEADDVTDWRKQMGPTSARTVIGSVKPAPGMADTQISWRQNPPAADTDRAAALTAAQNVRTMGMPAAAMNRMTSATGVPPAVAPQVTGVADQDRNWRRGAPPAHTMPAPVEHMMRASPAATGGIEPAVDQGPKTGKYVPVHLRRQQQSDTSAP
jgi:hypothetical protein